MVTKERNILLYDPMMGSNEMGSKFVTSDHWIIFQHSCVGRWKPQKGPKRNEAHVQEKTTDKLLMRRERGRRMNCLTCSPC